MSRYPSRAWVQISIELSYLIIVLMLALFVLFSAAITIVTDRTSWATVQILGTSHSNRTLLLWLLIALSGVCGGATFSLKWLYHSVAKGFWNQDRIIWRFATPIISAIIAVFTGAMITSDIIPFMSDTSLENPVTCLGFGFFIGWFSDNLLAKLRNYADKLFGTMEQLKKDNNQNNK